MKTIKKAKPTSKAKVQAEQFETLRRGLWLQASAWRGRAAELELIGFPDNDAEVNTLHNCAMELDRTVAKLADQRARTPHDRAERVA